METTVSTTQTGAQLGNSNSLLKRLTDIVIAALAAVPATPILAIACIAIKLEDPGPALYLQNRCTRNGRIFKIFKLRTMVQNADRIGPVLTQKYDPRITKVGRFLRRTSIDELPQIFNVLRGEMSIVGPRPEVPSIVETYSEEIKEVLNFKPGITGIAQVSGRAILDVEPKARMDIAYYRRATWWSDFKILLKTPLVVISNEGNVM